MIRSQAAAIARRLPPLQIEAERVAMTIVQGLHGRRRAGQGETFWQFRRYQPSDQIRRIDWRRSARDRQLHVRETEWEAAQSVWIWRDASASMAYRSHRNLPEKRDRAEVLAVALAILLADGGENVALLGAGQPARSGAHGRNQFIEAITSVGQADNLPPSLPLPRHAAVILIGDFLEPVATYSDTISVLVGQGCTGHCLQVLDPSEEVFPFDGRILFEGVERAESRLIRRAGQVREQYQDRLASHVAALRDMTRQVGWGFARHHTDQPAETALLSLYTALASKRVRKT